MAGCVLSQEKGAPHILISLVPAWRFNERLALTVLKPRLGLISLISESHLLTENRNCCAIHMMWGNIILLAEQ